jgi:hypothetical protein
MKLTKSRKSMSLRSEDSDQENKKKEEKALMKEV